MASGLMRPFLDLMRVPLRQPIPGRFALRIRVATLFAIWILQFWYTRNGQGNTVTASECPLPNTRYCKNITKRFLKNRNSQCLCRYSVMAKVSPLPHQISLVRASRTDSESSYQHESPSLFRYRPARNCLPFPDRRGSAAAGPL